MGKVLVGLRAQLLGNGSNFVFAVSALMAGAVLFPAAASAQASESAEQSTGKCRSPAAGQTADAPECLKVADRNGAPAIVVTGIRGSLQRAVAAKRRSDSVTETVTAEDVGKLPGVSIAESLARLAGVAAQRVDGRAQVLSIRGMAPKFGVTLLNGSEVVSTGDDRSFEYDQFPGELIGAATIYKTPDASLGTMGMSGTIDLRTIRPLDYKERKINLSARAEYNSFNTLMPGTRHVGNRLTASYIDQFDDGRIGVALGFAHLDSPIQKKYFNPWDYDTIGNFGFSGNKNDYYYDGFETGVMNWKTIRDGALGVLQFKPSNIFSSELNVFGSKFIQRMNGRELAGVLANWAPGTTPAVSVNSTTGAATVTNESPIFTSRRDNRIDKLGAVSWMNRFDSGPWHGQANLSYSRAKRTEWRAEAYAMPTNPITMTVNIPSTYDHFGQVSSPFDFGNPANYTLTGVWWGGGAFSSNALVNDRLYSGRASIKRDLDAWLFRSVEAGVIYSDRKKTLNYLGGDWNYTNPVPCDGGLTCSATTPAGLYQPSIGLGFAGVPSLISFDTVDALNSGAYVFSNDGSANPAWNWGVREKITTSFAKLELNHQGPVSLRGNIGVQVVHVDQSATGLYKDSSGTLNPISDGTSYTDVLPSLNLVFDFGHSLLVRFGAAKAAARPELGDMRAGLTASVSQIDRMWYGSGGNPKLKPWISNDLDLSVEKYFGGESYLAAAAFLKDVKTGIATESVPHDFTGLPNPSAIKPISNIGTLDAPVNTAGGIVKGYELSGTLGGNLLGSWLTGFGITGSFSYTSTKARKDSSGVLVSGLLEGLSGDVYSLSAFYERNGFQARVGERYRSGFSATRHNAFKFVTDTVRPERIVDAQIGYTIPSGPARNLGFLLQGLNLTNAPYVTTQTVDGHTALKERHEFGRQFLFGVSYSF